MKFSISSASSIFLAGLLLVGCGKQSSNETTEQSSQQQAAQQQQAYDMQLNKCVMVAQNLKYKSGQCAFNIINKCLETGSREEMENAYRADLVSGDAFSGYGTCSYYPTTYSKAFDKF